ncbi:MAG TPA: DoxX family protein [Acidimicrobiia bacterium]
MDALEIVMLVARVWAGVVMLAHGINHARSQEGTAAWFDKVGFRSPALNARMAAVTEIAIGLGLIVGLLTSFAAAGLVATMAGAFWSVHRFAGFFVFHRPDEGYEYVVTLAMLALVIATVGPGPVSGDALVGIDDTFNGAAGAAIVGLGILAGALQLAAFWRRPQRDDQ